MKIVFISCVSKKLNHKAKAQDLYISPLFKMNLAYARALRADKIFVLSAKYGLVALNQVLRPYNQSLNSMSAEEIKQWAEQVRCQLAGKVDFEYDTAIFLAGERYRKHLLPHFKNTDVPLLGLGIGKQLQFLKNKLKNVKQLPKTARVGK